MDQNLQHLKMHKLAVIFLFQLWVFCRFTSEFCDMLSSYSLRLVSVGVECLNTCLTCYHKPQHL